MLFFQGLHQFTKFRYMKVLSKTDFIHYLRCPDSLWLEKNKPDKWKDGEVSLFVNKLIKEGYEVEEYAK